MKINLARIVWRMILLCGACLLGWQIFNVNLVDHYVDGASRGKSGALQNALFWDKDHPKSQSLYAAQLIEEGKPEQAERWLISAIVSNPADARSLLLLAGLRQQAGEQELADRMVDTANRLMPVDALVQRHIAFYWSERGQLERSIAHLATSLSSNPSYREELFPVFLQLAENPETRKALRPITESPPAWWESFAVYASRNARDVESLRTLARMRSESDVRLVSNRARSAYIDRLKKEGYFAEAYLLWVDGMSKDQKGTLAYLYNGGFEQDFSQSGFGWRATPPRKSGIVISTAKTYGITGDQALYLSFAGKRQPFSHLRQSLFLGSGRYKFSGKVRVDNLKARKGLQWVVQCDSGEGGKLGESQRFIGGSDWLVFEFEFEVPGNCKGQLLSLRSVGHRDVDHELDGEIWFDDMRIRLQR